MSTAWVADTHVHLYPGYDLGRLFRAAITNLRALAGGPDDRLVLFLTERQDCHMFDALQQGTLSLPESVSVVPGGESLEINMSGDSLTVLPGRQILTRDRLEVLSLTVDDAIPDGGELEDILQQVRDVDGTPVLPWSPGKWMGERGERIRGEIQRGEPGRLFVGDILMRAHGVPEPPAFRLARQRGLTLLAGTDPLPTPGEEDLVGRYAIRIQGDNPRDALATAEIVGSRQGLVAAGARWARHNLQSTNQRAAQTESSPHRKGPGR